MVDLDQQGSEVGGVVAAWCWSLAALGASAAREEGRLHQGRPFHPCGQVLLLSRTRPETAQGQAPARYAGGPVCPRRYGRPGGRSGRFGAERALPAPDLRRPRRTHAAGQERKNTDGRGNRDAQGVGRARRAVPRALGVRRSQASGPARRQRRRLVPERRRPLHPRAAREGRDCPLPRSRSGNVDSTPEPRPDRPPPHDRRDRRVSRGSR